MKAVRFHRTGGPDVLKLEGTAVPVSREQQIPIRSANHVDLALRA